MISWNEINQACNRIPWPSCAYRATSLDLYTCRGVSRRLQTKVITVAWQDRLFRRPIYPGKWSLPWNIIWTFLWRCDCMRAWYSCSWSPPRGRRWSCEMKLPHMCEADAWRLQEQRIDFFYTIGLSNKSSSNRRMLLDDGNEPENRESLLASQVRHFFGWRKDWKGRHGPRAARSRRKERKGLAQIHVWLWCRPMSFSKCVTNTNCLLHVTIFCYVTALPYLRR